MEWKQIDYQLRDVLIDSLLKSKILDRIKFHRNENDRFHDHSSHSNISSSAATPKRKIEIGPINRTGK